MDTPARVMGPRSRRAALRIVGGGGCRNGPQPRRIARLHAHSISVPPDGTCHRNAVPPRARLSACGRFGQFGQKREKKGLIFFLFFGPAFAIGDSHKTIVPQLLSSSPPARRRRFTSGSSRALTRLSPPPPPPRASWRLSPILPASAASSRSLLWQEGRQAGRQA